jgi:hypothetical protein
LPQVCFPLHFTFAVAVTSEAAAALKAAEHEHAKLIVAEFEVVQAGWELAEFHSAA